MEHIAAAKCLHDIDRNAFPLAQLIQRLPLRVDAFAAIFIILRVPKLFTVLRRRLHIIRRIDREHQDIEQSRLHGFPCDHRIMRAHAETMNLPFRL